ncbi:hypothetical protein ABW19_dt0200425 [Dactylella cylindrospora]|nr:hypothetical protein ABW19_dt0200425 [Dactylella cylindrospora]
MALLILISIVASVLARALPTETSPQLQDIDHDSSIESTPHRLTKRFNDIKYNSHPWYPTRYPGVARLTPYPRLEWYPLFPLGQQGNWFQNNLAGGGFADGDAANVQNVLDNTALQFEAIGLDDGIPLGPPEGVDVEPLPLMPDGDDTQPMPEVRILQGQPQRLE